MEVPDSKGQLDLNFRLTVLNHLIIKALNECSQNSQEPNILHKINDIAIKFEQRVFEKAVSKDDYVAKIHQRLTHAKSKLIDALGRPSTDKQSMLSTQPHSCQKRMVASLTSIQPRDMGTQQALNGFHQDWQMSQQSAPFQNDFQYPDQQSMSIKEAFGTPHGVLNVDSCQRSVEISNQVTNCHVSQMHHLGSSSQGLNTLVNSLEKRNQFQDISSLQGSQIPAIPQAQMAATKLQGASSSFADSEGINAADWNVLITQFQRMRLAYLPELIKLLEKAEGQCAHAQNIEQFQKTQKARVVLGRMINFLLMTEREIMVHPIEKLNYFMKQIIQFVVPTHKSNNTVSTGNQASQFSASHALMSGLSSALSTENGIPCLQSGASNSVRYGPCTTQQMDMQLRESAIGTIDHTHLKLKENLQPVQSSTVNQAPLEMLLSGKSHTLPQKKESLSMFNPTCGVSQQNFSRGQFSVHSHNSWLSSVPSDGHPQHTKVPQSSAIPMDQENNISSSSNIGATSQPKTPVLVIDSPSTPQAPSSLSKEIEKPVQSTFIASSAKKNGDLQDSGEASSTQDRTEEQVKASVTPGLSARASKQIPHVAKQPVERLIEAVQSTSWEALLSSIDDIAAAISSLDRLSDVDLANFPSHASQAIKGNIGGQKPFRKVKRDINSTSWDASMIQENDDSSSMQLTMYLFNSTANISAKRPRTESNHDLLDEIRKINQKLVETVIEVASDSIKNASAPEASKGTTVRCTYRALALSENFKRNFASATPVLALSVEFLVPLDYPNSPPQCLDSLPEEYREDAKDLTDKAKLRFNQCARGVEHPMSLGEIARAWDNCARSVLSEFSLCVGGESFSSKYGSWECIPAA